MHGLCHRDQRSVNGLAARSLYEFPTGVGERKATSNSWRTLLVGLVRQLMASPGVVAHGVIELGARDAQIDAGVERRDPGAGPIEVVCRPAPTSPRERRATTRPVTSISSSSAGSEPSREKSTDAIVPAGFG